MQSDLKIALIQTDIVWQNARLNRVKFTEKIQQINAGTDLILLPEMCTTGFSMEPSGIAENMEGETVKWMLQMASEKQAVIAGSVIINDGDFYYNRFLFAFPKGNIAYYDKRHLFTLAGEEKVYCQGNRKVIITIAGWKICPMICYDLRFPVWARNTEGYDALIYVANWPKPRIIAWDTLLKARAIENMCFTVGVNRVGPDANDLEYTGHSAVYDFLGNQLTTNAHNNEEILYANLNKDAMDKTRNQLNFLGDKDDFTLSH